LRLVLTRMPNQPAPPRSLTGRQYVTPPGERVLAALQLDSDRRARKPQRVAEAVLEIAAVVIRRPLGLRAVDHDQRRPAAALMRVAQPDLAAARQRRRVGPGQLLQDLIQPRRRQIAARGV